nr:E3 ubiquitin-protein ligase rififylin-like [Ovis aries]
MRGSPPSLKSLRIQDLIMWAACCNWFCLDGQPEEAPPPQGARTQAYSNPGYSSFPSPTGSEPSCKACGAHFASMARKQTCLDCKKNFCTNCSSQVGAGPRLCLLCQRFRATAFRREELMKMKVKDLRDYLSLHDISTDMCREKEELVSLVLGQQPVISQEGRTQVPPLGPDFPEQQAFLTRPHTSAVPPTSPGLPSAPPGQAQGRQQANGHVSQDQEEPVYLERTARAHAEDETQSVDSEDSFVPGRRASLSDLTDLEDIEGLTVRQLKEILARNFVNYKGCCEKWELMERVTRLYKDQKGLQHLISQRGSCSATYETPTQKQVVYEWFSTRCPTNVRCVTGEGAAAFPAAPRVPGRRALRTGPGPDARRGRAAAAAPGGGGGGGDAGDGPPAGR